MYDYIKGNLVEIFPTQAIIETGGIGYKLEISLGTFAEIQSLQGTDIKLYIYYHVKEDVALWFGFFDKEERDVFILLIGVNGIGPNTARMILSSLSTQELKSAIIGNDVNRIKSVKGIGLKTAQRVIIDLKDKVVKGADSSTLPLGGVVSSPISEEALGALIMLGFSKASSQKAISEVIKESPNLQVEEVIKKALKKL